MKCDEQCNRSLELNSKAVQNGSVAIGDYQYKPEFVGLDSPVISLEKRCPELFSPKTVTHSSIQSSLDGSRLPLSSFNGLLHQVYSKKRFFGFSSRRQRGRVFHRAKTGALIARHQGSALRWLTLTTPLGYNGNLCDDFEVLRKRLEHVSYKNERFNPFHLEYSKVETSEGNGVLHVLFKASPLKNRSYQAKLNCRKRKYGRPVNPKFDIGFIDFSWLKANWAQIVNNPVPNSQNVYIEYVYGSAEKVAGYLIQYSAGQDSLERLSWSHGWLYRGCVKEWNLHFRPKVAEVYSYRCSLEDSQFNAEMRAIYRDWDKWILEKVA